MCAARIRYNGGLPGASEEVILAGPLLPSIAGQYGWVMVEVYNSNAGDLVLYSSEDNSSWSEHDRVSVGEISSNMTVPYDFYIGNLKYVKLCWDNGISAQTQFDIACALVESDSGGVFSLLRSSQLWIEGDFSDATITSDAYEDIPNHGQAGGSATQSLAADRPAAAHVEAGGVERPVLLFDGTDDHMGVPDCSFLDSATGAEIWFTASPGSVGYYFDNAQREMLMHRSSAGQINAYVGTPNYQKITGIDDGESHLYRVRFNGAGTGNAERLRTWVDAIEQPDNSVGTIPAALSASSHNQCTIGARYTGTAPFLNHRLEGLLVIFDRLLSDGEASVLSAYSLDKYINPNVFLQQEPSLYLDHRYNVYASAGSVTEHYDVSGHDNDVAQPLSLEQPTFTSGSHIGYDGSENNMHFTSAAASRTLGATNTFAIVGKLYSGGPANGVVLRTDTASLLVDNVSGAFQWQNGTDVVDIEDPRSDVLDWFTLVVTQNDAGNLIIRLDGVEVYNDAATTALSGQVLEYIGGNDTSANSQFDERTIQWYQEVKSGTDLTALETALNALRDA